jgi:hypothetical protein
MRTATTLFAAMVLSALTAAAQAQQGPGVGMAPGTYSASKIGDATAAASSKMGADGPKVKANEKAYSSVLHNLPDKQYDPWHGLR